eukprot:jgi/Picsp_1/1106/NSC_04589-R1_protein
MRSTTGRDIILLFLRETQRRVVGSASVSAYIGKLDNLESSIVVDSWNTRTSLSWIRALCGQSNSSLSFGDRKHWGGSTRAYTFDDARILMNKGNNRFLSDKNVVSIDTADQDNTGPTAKENVLLYDYKAPFSQAVRKVKKLSLFSLACAVGAGPVMIGLDSHATSLMAKASLSATLSGFGLFTTYLLYWFTYPYVHELEYFEGRDGQRYLKIKQLNFFAREKQETIPLEDIEAGEINSMHPLSTFMARGRVYYIDKDYFGDRELLKLLDPPMVKE